MTITGRAVAFIPTARPAIMLVPWPVVLACAIDLTGAYLLEVKYSVINTIKAVTTIPIMVHQMRLERANGKVTSFKTLLVINQKPMAESTPLTPKPRYRGIIMFLVFSLAFTKKVPIMLATIAIAPSSICHWVKRLQKGDVNTRVIKAKPAIFGAEAKKVVIEVGDPSYTSGVHI